MLQEKAESIPINLLTKCSFLCPQTKTKQQTYSRGHIAHKVLIFVSTNKTTDILTDTYSNHSTQKQNQQYPACLPVNTLDGGISNSI